MDVKVMVNHPLTDLEFDIIDELYFLTSFAQLLSAVEIKEEQLMNNLWNMYSKGLIHCYVNSTEQIIPVEPEFRMHYAKYHYLATKEGLLAHNS